MRSGRNSTASATREMRRGKRRPGRRLPGPLDDPEYNRNTGRGFFGADMRRAVKEIRGHLERLKFKEYQEKGGLESELFYKEVCHMVRIYIDLCATDHSYNSTIFGMFRMGADQSKNKIMADVRDVAVRVPETLELQEELAIVTKAAAEVYEEAFPYEGGLF